MSDDFDIDDLEGLCEDAESAKQQPEPVKPAAPAKSSSNSLEFGEIEIINPLESVGDTRSALEFSDLDTALKEQPGLFAFYSECAAQAMRQYNKAKHNVEFVAAKLNHTFRQEAIDNKEKVTEKALESRVSTSQAYVLALECQNDAQYINKLCTSLVEAFSQREQMIIQSCKRAELEMFSKGSFTSREDRNKALAEALKTA